MLAAERHMAKVNGSPIPAERIVTIGDFATNVYLPWVDQQKRPSTAKGYRDVWECHLEPLCASKWLKDTQTFHVQGWLNQIGQCELSRNTLKHIRSVLSAIFTMAKQQGYFDGANPVQNSAINPNAPEPQETYAYSLNEIQDILAILPEPAATIFAVASFMGLRHGEIQGLQWEDYRGGEMFVSRSIWNGHVTEPKTRKGKAPIPVVRQLANRLEMHRMRSGHPQSGPIFANSLGRPENLNNVLRRVILPNLNRCRTCQKSESDHLKELHKFERDSNIPEWHGWHAARRGLGSNLYRLGVPDQTIQRILRHANVNTTATYYIKTAAGDVHDAMKTLEDNIPETPISFPDTNRTPNSTDSATPVAVN